MSIVDALLQLNPSPEAVAWFYALPWKAQFQIKVAIQTCRRERAKLKMRNYT